MPFALYSDVRETAPAPGTAAFVPSAAFDSKSFRFGARYADTWTGFYDAKGVAGREIGVFTFNDLGGGSYSLSRAPIKSTNADALVNFASGTVDISVTDIAPSDLTATQLATLMECYGALSFKASQSLTDAQKTRAMTNIGANEIRVNAVQQRYVAESPWLLGKSAVDNGWTWVTWSHDLALFVAVGESGTGNRVMTSENGVDWTIRTSSADVNWHGVVWSSKLRLFAACATNVGGGTVRIMTSPDGITWTSRITPSANSYNIIDWSDDLGLFVAVGSDVITSPDGINWTAHTAPVTTAALAWSPTLALYVAVGNNAVMTSPDGSTWTSQTPAEANNWHGVAWNSKYQVFAAVSLDGTNRVMTSPDGITWTARSAAAANQWRGVWYAPEIGLLCAVAGTGTGNGIMTSPDGVTWTARVPPADNSWLAVTWSAQLGIFCAISYTGSGNRVMVSVSAHSAGKVGDYISVDNGGGTSATATFTNGSQDVSVTHLINVQGGVRACVPCVLTTTGTLPTNFSPNTVYWAVPFGSGTCRLAASAAHALDGTFITAGSAGSGTHTFRTNAIPLANNTTINLAAMIFPAGDFDATASAVYAGDTSTVVNGVLNSIGTSSAVLNQVVGYYGKLAALGTPFSGGGDILINTTTGRITKTVPTPHYLVGFMGFGTSFAQVNSVGISARRNKY